MAERGRVNQKQRTRKALLSAAVELMKSGRFPTVAEVAEEAEVSRATAYRYFPTQEVLVAEAPLDDEVPTPDDVFKNDRSDDPEERLDRAERCLHDMIYANEPQLRVMLSKSLANSPPRGEMDGTPIRQNRRGALIEAALAPVRDRLDDATYERLVAALSCFFGTESMVVFGDVLQMNPNDARAVKSWAIRALVRAALEESGKSAR